MVHGSLFSGIGGFDLAARWCGWDNAFHCEWAEFPRRVLQYHFPKAKSCDDIRETDFRPWRGRIDVLSGGFPCQPFSMAGKRKGAEDDRYLWPEMLRAIDEIRPTWVVGENVAGLLSMVQPSEVVRVEGKASIFGEDEEELIMEQSEFVIETICRDFERLGYAIQPIVIPACAVGAPHRRDRVWFIANATSRRWDKRSRTSDKPPQDKSQWAELQRNDWGLSSIGLAPYPKRNGLQRWDGSAIGEVRPKIQPKALYSPENDNHWQEFPTQPPICGGDDGIPRVLDSITFSRWRSESIKAYGNAIVPQVAYEIFTIINKIEISND